MKNTIINTDKRTFLISFQWKTTENKFIVNTPKALIEVLQTMDNNGIEYIKEFDSTKYKFAKTSKDSILQWAKWDTEVNTYLNNHYYFKK